tara:strand:+ start:458 stop:805 length:348 start_codon:yes stop_codon:yes gene_type:complete
MTKWTAKKAAHVDTWFSLFRLGQIRKHFNASGKIKMSELTFFNPTVSNDSLNIEATLIADTIDRVFTSWGAKLENNISRNTAINEMIKILLDVDKTILDLAEINDENYFFINETN